MGSLVAPVFDDEGLLNYQRSLDVKPQKYSREIVYLQQDRKSAGNSAGGWIVQEDGKPFPFEAHYSTYLVTRAINALRNLMQTEHGGSTPFISNWTSSIHTSPFPFPRAMRDELYDLQSQDAVNLIEDPDHAEVRGQMIRLLASHLQRLPRWTGFWAEFRIARYASLPQSQGDMQLFTKPS